MFQSDELAKALERVIREEHELLSMIDSHYLTDPESSWIEEADLLLDATYSTLSSVIGQLTLSKIPLRQAINSLRKAGTDVHSMALKRIDF